MYLWLSPAYQKNEYNNKYLYLNRELFYMVLGFLRLRRNFVEKMQSSHYIVISYLVRQMDLDIVEETTVMAYFEKSGLVQVQPSGELEKKSV